MNKPKLFEYLTKDELDILPYNFHYLRHIRTKNNTIEDMTTLDIDAYNTTKHPIIKSSKPISKIINTSLFKDESNNAQ